MCCVCFCDTGTSGGEDYEEEVDPSAPDTDIDLAQQVPGGGTIAAEPDRDD